MQKLKKEIAVNNVCRTVILFAIFLLTVILLNFLLRTTDYGLRTASAYVSSSTNYRIQIDTLNVGGLLSTSTNFQIEDTLTEEGIGTSSSAVYNIKAGYQQMQDVYIAVSVPGNVTLTPDIPTTGGGTGNGSLAWTVTTDNPGGYTMNIRASSSPALSSGSNNFADYTPASSDPDYAFSIAASVAEFGFTPEGTDIVEKYKDNGSACNAGSSDTASACWMPITTSAETIAQSSAANNPSGTETTIRFRAQSGASNTQPAGSYSATVTLTVIPL